MREGFKKITTSQTWRSIFRHGYEDTLRNRALEVTSNVFLHLHPITIPPPGVFSSGGMWG